MKSQNPRMKPLVELMLGAALILSGDACARLKVWTGARISLEKVPISSLTANLQSPGGLAPGEHAPLVVTLQTRDGKTLQTEGSGHGVVMWQDLAISAEIVQVNNRGIVSMPADPRLSDGKQPHLIVTLPSQPGLQAELNIPLRYDQSFSANFSGPSGSSGMDGQAGTDGSMGSSGSSDPDHPVPGGDGSDGGSGTDGDNGGRGGDALPVEVRVSLRAGSHPLLQVRVSNAQRQEFFLVDPQGGSLQIKAEGGSGGSGGRGGRGGSGGSGGMGSPDGRRGNDGSSGHDGWSGSDGNAGPITVIYDPQVKPFLACIRLLNGSDRDPAMRIYKEEPVQAPW